MCGYEGIWGKMQRKENKKKKYQVIKVIKNNK